MAKPKIILPCKNKNKNIFRRPCSGNST